MAVMSQGLPRGGLVRVQKRATSPWRARQGGQTASTEAEVCGGLGAVWGTPGPRQRCGGLGRSEGVVRVAKRKGREESLGDPEGDSS